MWWSHKNWICGVNEDIWITVTVTNGDQTPIQTIVENFM